MAILAFVSAFLLINIEPSCGQVLKNNADSPKQISEYIRKVIQDKQGSLWFGTNDEGIVQFDGTSLRYHSSKEGLAGRAVRSILQDSSGAMWFATDRGVSRYRDEKFQSFTQDNGLSDIDTWSLLEDRQGTLWVGTKSGACRWNGQSFESFELPQLKIPTTNYKIAPKLVWCMECDKEGNIWFGTDGSGAYRFDGKTVCSFTDRDGLSSNQVACIARDHRGLLWFGFVNGGVSSYDGQNFNQYAAKNGLPDGWVWTMTESTKGELLVSVLGAGVLRFADNRFQMIEAQNQGLPKHVQSIFEDREGNLWLGCSGGLFRVVAEELINVTREGPWKGTQERQALNALPLNNFEQLIRDSWTVTANTGRKMRHEWRRGPGRYSIKRWTDGESAMGDPWRELIVYYWHPQEKRVKLLGVSPFQSGISRGVIEFDGTNATADIRLSQTLAVRQMQTQWRFSNANHYRETLREKDAHGKLFELVAFEHVREPDTKNRRSDTDSVHSTVVLSSELEKLRFLLGENWTCHIEGGPEKQLTTSIEWIPNANFLYGKAWLDEASHTAANQPVLNQQESEAWLNFYIYHDVESRKTQCLALAKDSNVYEGEVDSLHEGNIQVELTSNAPNAKATIRMTIEAVDDRQMLQHLQFNEDGRSLRLKHAR